jgi:branched-chain amino acid transport system ATP-binding protein
VTAAPGQGQPVLEAAGLCVGYGGNPVVRELDLRVHAGEVVALLGANGAGKTTTLLGLAGELRPIRGAVRMYGNTVTAPLHRRARAGLAYISEEKSVISELSVTDNLRLGRGDIDIAFRAFPELDRLRRRRAGTLSGGEQQVHTAPAASDRAYLLKQGEVILEGASQALADRIDDIEVGYLSE